MKVALVHDWLTGMRGGEKCLEIFCELFPDGDLYTLVCDPSKVSPAIRRMNIKTSWIERLPAARKHFRYFLPFFPKAIEGFQLGGYDLIISSSHCVAKGINPGCALHISYVHSPMRYVWDMHDAYFGKGAPWAARAGMALCRSYLQRWDVSSAKRVDCFIANSTHIAGKIENLYGRSCEVIYPPADLEKFHISDCQEPFYLIVSALVPYKNIQLAVAAFNQLRLPLKVVGDGPLRKTLAKEAGATIEFTGWVDDARLAEYYAKCEALIFPGEEDFGIVPLEAQASGRPVIAYARGGVTESVVGLDDPRRGAKPTGLFFSEAKPASLIEAVRRYLAIRHMFDPAALRRHAGQFSRAVFKTRMEEFIKAKLLERTGSVVRNAKTV